MNGNRKRISNNRMVTVYETREGSPSAETPIDGKHSRMARQSHEAIKLIKTEDMPEVVEFLQDKSGIKKR